MSRTQTPCGARGEGSLPPWTGPGQPALLWASTVVQQQASAGALRTEQFETLQVGVVIEESLAVAGEAWRDDQAQLVDEVPGEQCAREGEAPVDADVVAVASFEVGDEGCGRLGDEVTLGPVVGQGRGREHVLRRRVDEVRERLHRGARPVRRPL